MYSKAYKKLIGTNKKWFKYLYNNFDAGKK